VVAVVLAAALSGRVQIVSAPSSSTADRPAAYGPATSDASGVYHGSHFRAAVPAGWQPVPPPKSAPNTELVLKQQPTNVTNPVIIVSAQDGPTNLPLEAYADIERGHDLQDSSTHAVGSIQTTSLDGERAQTYVLARDGTLIQNIIVIRGGVAYSVQFAAPSAEFNAAKAGPLRSFLSSWHWE
jgi:hypothetical protein